MEDRGESSESVLDTILELSPSLLKGGFSPTRDANISPSPDSGSEDSDSLSGDDELHLQELDELLIPVAVPDSGVTSGRSIVYTDGSCTSATRVSGVRASDGREWDYSGPGTLPATGRSASNQPEGRAVGGQQGSPDRALLGGDQDRLTLHTVVGQEVEEEWV